MIIITDQEFHDITVQFMTDEEKYEMECGVNTEDCIKQFINIFGQNRWDQISKA